MANKKLEPGDEVKMNAHGVATFPRRKGLSGYVMPQRGFHDDVVKVKWDGIATPEKLPRNFLSYVRPR